MQLNQVSAMTGIEWFRQGIKNFTQQPAAMLSLFILYFSIMAILSLIPLLGPFLLAILGPFLNNIFFLAGREIHLRKKVDIKNLLATIKEYDAVTKKKLVLLGIFYLICVTLITNITTALGLKLFNSGAIDLQQLTSSQQQELVTNLFLLATFNIPVTLLFWFAPIFIGWHQVRIRQALFYGLVTMWKNFGAFFIYFICWIGLAIVAALIIGFIILISVPKMMAVSIFIIFFISFCAAFYTSFYVTYHGCYSINNNYIVKT